MSKNAAANMDHKAVVSTLTADQRRSLTRRSNSKGLAALLFHLGAIGVVTSLIILKVWLWPVLLVVQGVLLVFLFTLMHESIHRTAFRTRWVNDLCAQLSGFVILTPAEWFRFFHFAHHRHTQDPELDPELAHPKPETWPGYFWHITGFPIWIGSISTLFRLAFRHCDDPFVPESGRGKVVIEARVYLLLYGFLLLGSLAIGTPLLAWVWIIPLVLGQPFLRLYLLAEHGRCAYVANMLQNSRTTFTNRFVRRLAWNMPYHAEHHSFPAVPFHQLPALHEHIKDHLKVTENGYARFHRKYVRRLGTTGATL